MIESNDQVNKYQQGILDEEWDIDYNNPKSTNLISSYFATNKRDGSKVILTISDNQLAENNTLDQLVGLNHENITKVLGYRKNETTKTRETQKNSLVLFIEYLDGFKSIPEMLSGGYKFSEDQIRMIAHYLVYALAYLHKYHIIHKDIKPGNILIHIGNNGSIGIKLGGLEFSWCYGNNESIYFTPIYAAPEIFSQNSKGTFSDIWSLGCTLIEVAGGDLLNRQDGLPIIPSNLSNQLRNFIQHCLIVDPYSRPKATELIHHEFIQIDGSVLNNEVYINSKVINNSIELNNQQLNDITITIASNITHVVLPEFNDQDLSIVFNKLPSTVTHLSLPVFNQMIKAHSIPSSIQSLSIPSFNQEIEDDVFPPTLTELEFGQVFEFNENGSWLPDTIKKLKCSYNFDKPLRKNNNIPRSVSILILDNYNQSITKFSIPSTVYSLTLGSNFQEKDLASLSNLPASVFNLTFGVSSECTLKDDQIIQLIPPQVTKLIFNRHTLSLENLHISKEWSFDYSNPLGQGASGLVYKGKKTNSQINGRSIPNGGQCAIKIVRLDSVYKTETDILDKLMDIHLDNLVDIYGYAYGSHSINGIEKKCLFIYMEYLDGYDSISNYVKKNGKLPETQIAKIAKTIVYTLATLHENHQIAHRDIKGDNILIDSDGNVRIIDFGCNKFFGPDSINNHTGAIGTFGYIAPELFNNNNSKTSVTRADIWSIGCTIIEMAGGSLIKKDSLAPNIPDHLSKICRNFIQQCLIYDPICRPKASQLIQHEFLSDTELPDKQNDIKNLSTNENQKSQISNSELDKIQFIEESISILELLEYNKVDYEDDFIKLPPSITSLILPVFNQPIKTNSIPSSIQSLSIPSFNQEIEEDSIPPNLTELEFSQVFEFNENGDRLPDTIKKLKCSYNFDKPLKRNNNIPNLISILILDNYNQPITKFSIPSTVYSLTLGSNFQEKDLASLSNLPPSVFNLTFGVSSECTLKDDQIIQLIPPQVTNLKILYNNNNNNN